MVYLYSRASWFRNYDKVSRFKQAIPASIWTWRGNYPRYSTFRTRGPRRSEPLLYPFTFHSSNIPFECSARRGRRGRCMFADTVDPRAPRRIGAAIWNHHECDIHVTRLLYQERDLPCHVTNFTIFGTQCLNLHEIVYSYLANRCRSHWDTTDAAAKSVHSGESPLHYNIDSFCASEIVA
jgi:hypothetical protein